MKQIFVLFFVVLSLSGCGLPTLKPGDPLVTLQQSDNLARAECYKAQERTKMDISSLSEQGKMIIVMQQGYERMISAFTGKTFDPCGSGTNLNDVIIATNAQKNETVRVVVKETAGTAKFGLGAWFGYKAVDSIGQNAGVKTFGDNSPATKTVTSTETNAPAINAGDGSANSGGAPSGTVGIPTSVDSLPVITAE